MKELLLELYNITEAEYKKLSKKYNDDVLLKNRTHFIYGNASRPITAWELYYYIDNHGDFINRGKLCHHNIARSIFECMDAKSKIDILSYIDEYGKEKE